MEYKLPAFICNQSPRFRQCMKWEVSRCIEAAMPAVKACMSTLPVQKSDGELDRNVMTISGMSLLQCSIKSMLQAAESGDPWDSNCVNVVDLDRIDPRLDVVFVQDGAIRIARDGHVRLSNSPFVIHVSSANGIPGLFSTRLPQAFPGFQWTMPKFLAPVARQTCQPDTLCPTTLPFVVQAAPALLTAWRSRLSAAAAEELERIALTYDSAAQVVLAEINGNFKATDKPGSFEYRVSNTASLISEIDGKSARIWIVIVMNDQPQKFFPYARIRPILIEIRK